MPRAFFFILVLTLWFGLHLYIGQSLIKPLPLKPTARRVAWAVWSLLMLLAPAAMALRFGSLPQPYADVLNMASYIYMGVFLLLVVGVLLRDLALGLARAADWLLSRPPAPPTEADPKPRRGGAVLPVDPSRRAFLQNTLNAGLITTTGALGAKGFYNARHTPAIKPVEITFPDLPPALDGLRIVQLSDLHIGPTLKADFLETVVQATLNLKPDLIALTGDLVDGFSTEMAHEVAALGQLKATYGVYGVTGNHEYYWDAEGWIETFNRLGVRMLNNEHALLPIRGASLLVAGVTDLSAERALPSHATDPHKARGSAAADLKLLLAHQPKSVYGAAEAGFDLQLSGHTHGGQFFPGTFIVGRVHPFTAGLGRYNDKLQIYVSRGTGYWGPPLRLGAPSEITLITLRRA